MRRFFTILVATLAFTISANASVTLQECRDKARENYPLVRRYDLIRATKECNVHNASLSWLPRLELGGGGLQLVPKARLYDALADVMIIPKLGFLTILKEGLRAFKGTMISWYNVLCQNNGDICRFRGTSYKSYMPNCI